MYTERVSSRAVFGQYQDTETTPVLIDTQGSWPQGYTTLPTLPEPRDDLYARGVSQFRAVSRHREHPQTIDTQVPPLQRRSGLPTSPELRGDSYSPNVSPGDFRTASGHSEHHAQYLSLATMRIWQPAHCLISPFKVYRFAHKPL